MFDYDEIHRVLANPVRRDILRWLKTPAHYFPAIVPSGTGITAGMVHTRTDLSKSTESAHLAALRRAGLVNMVQAKTRVYVSRNEQVIGSYLARILEELG
jgi:DNA-binding transcriptional ArsR family regulator